jgi:hypothetical protein
MDALVPIVPEAVSQQVGKWLRRCDLLDVPRRGYTVQSVILTAV